ncbi:unnamed protein product, partial [Iphiclides podalirius]
MELLLMLFMCGLATSGRVPGRECFTIGGIQLCTLPDIAEDYHYTSAEIDDKNKVPGRECFTIGGIKLCTLPDIAEDYHYTSAEIDDKNKIRPGPKASTMKVPRVKPGSKASKSKAARVKSRSRSSKSNTGCKFLCSRQILK